MDAATYIEQFRSAAAIRDSLATRALAARLRDEPWPTVALVTTRLTGVGVSRRPDDAPSPEAVRWFHEHLTDVLVAAHARVKATREGV
jgi:hypothetical protein